MTRIQADFSHRDGEGRLRLSDLRMHTRTPFARLARRGEAVTFIDGEDSVRGMLVKDPRLGWLGKADWSTQAAVEEYPAAAATR